MPGAMLSSRVIVMDQNGPAPCRHSLRLGGRQTKADKQRHKIFAYRDGEKETERAELKICERVEIPLRHFVNDLLG